MEIEVPILCNKNNGLDISMELGSTAIYNVQLHVLCTMVRIFVLVIFKRCIQRMYMCFGWLMCLSENKRQWLVLVSEIKLSSVIYLTLD